MLFNIHTHHITQENDIISIYNKNIFEKTTIGYFSTGVHPWDAITGSNYLEIIAGHLSDKKFLAV